MPSFELGKQAHFWAGMAIYGLAVAVMPIPYAIAPVIVAAALRELYGNRDGKDFFATVAGGLVGLAWNYGELV